jgi:hypothetical protein
MHGDRASPKGRGPWLLGSSENVSEEEKTVDARLLGAGAGSSPVLAASRGRAPH